MGSEGQLPTAQVTSETLNRTGEAIAAVRPGALATIRFSLC